MKCCKIDDSVNQINRALLVVSCEKLGKPLIVLTTSSFNKISTTKAMLKSRVDWTFGRWLDSLHKIKDSNKQTALPEQLLSNNAHQIKYKNDEDNLRRSFPPLNIYHW